MGCSLLSVYGGATRSGRGVQPGEGLEVGQLVDILPVVE
jgi:hypothetical protein